jgi:hypothetical protein
MDDQQPFNFMEFIKELTIFLFVRLYFINEHIIFFIIITLSFFEFLWKCF